MTFKLTSPEFEANGPIPAKYTCEGANISPPLEWTGAPKGTKKYALIVDDPDAPDPAAPEMVYVHWVLCNIPTSTTKLIENAAMAGLPVGTIQGTNDWKKQTYGGPCPPIGRHRYFFKLYALDAELKNLNIVTKADVEKAMKGHVLGTAELIGTYEKVETSDATAPAARTPAAERTPVKVKVLDETPINMQTSGVHHVSLRVSDLQRSKKFYVGTLGFKHLMDGDNICLFLAGGTAFGLRGPTAEMPNGDKFSPHRLGVDHIALACPDANELLRVAAALTAAGIENTGAKRDETLGKDYVAFKDPDRIAWEFYMA